MKTLFILPIAAFALLATACSGSDRTTVVNNSPESTGVTVSGRGEVQAVPDTGFFDVGVQFRARTVAEARDGAARAADAVIKSLKSNGINEKDIKTVNFSINPEYDFKNQAEPRIVAYTVSNMVSAKVRKLDAFSKVIDDAIAAGGDAVRLQGIRFDIEDNAKLLEQAREAAMKDAKKKAEQLASLGEVKLGKPQAINETQSSNPPAQLAFAAAEKGALSSTVPTPIQAGTGTVVVELTVRWGFEN
jgi:uncharacterized protein YggE